MKLENIEHARFRALAQIIIDKDKGFEAFESYMKLAFPYLEAVRKQDNLQAMEVLKREIQRGPIAVRPLPQHNFRSRLKDKLMSRKKPQTPEEADRLYKRIGPSIPYR